MKKRLKQALCLVSALVVMFVSFVVPASAEDSSGGSSAIARQFLDYYCSYHNINISDYGYIVTCETRKNQYNYYLVLFDKSITSIVATLYRPDFSCGFEVNVNGVYGSAVTYNSTSSFNQKLNDNWFSSKISHSTCYFTLTDNNTYVILTSCKSITVSNQDVTPPDPNAPVTPFTVSYSPALKEGMSRKGTLSAPGASNDGEEIESNGLNVRVTLTDEFIKLRDSYDELKDYTYEFICYITTAPPEKTSYKESLENAVYTSLDYGKYMYTTSGVVDDVTDDFEEPANWIKAEGINAGYIISKGATTKNVTINLENLDSSSFTEDTKLYIVVYGRLTSLSVPTPDYFDLDNQGYLCNQGSLNTKQIVTVNADPETGEGTDVNMPDYYCVTSDVFNYKDYPEYKPKIFKNGAEMDTNKPTTDYLDKKLTPDYMYDYDMDKNNQSGLAPDDFKKYEEQKKLDKNFGSFDFSLTGISDIFNGTSDFFKFLTASIAILPTTFLTVLISFFVLMLAICVVKWIL